MIFALAKVTRAKQFLQTNNLRAFFCRQAHPIDGLAEIGGWVLTGAHLDEPQRNFFSSCFWRHVVNLVRSNYSLKIKKGRGKAFPLPPPDADQKRTYFKCCAKNDLVFSQASFADAS